MLVTISFETELYNQEITTLFALDQAAEEGSSSEGAARVPSMSDNLFLTDKATRIARLHVTWCGLKVGK